LLTITINHDQEKISQRRYWLEASNTLEATAGDYLLQNADKFRERPVELIEHCVNEFGRSFRIWLEIFTQMILKDRRRTRLYNGRTLNLVLIGQDQPHNQNILTT